MTNYRRLENLREVFHLDEPPLFAQKKNRLEGKKGQGIRYERKVQAHFGRMFGDLYIPNPWFRFSLDRNPKWFFAQPDGLLFDFHSGRILIVEIKYSHTSDAYFQLIDLYLPLMRRFFGTDSWTFSVCEVVWWYDKAVAFPTQVRLRKDITSTEPTDFGVHILRP